MNLEYTGWMDAIGFMLLCSIRIFFGRLKHYLAYTAEGSIKIRIELAEV